MSQKWYCDGCGHELKEGEGFSVCVQVHDRKPSNYLKDPTTVYVDCHEQCLSTLRAGITLEVKS